MRKCVSCGQEKPVSEYYMISKRFYFTECKKCVSERRKSKYKREGSKLYQYAINYYIKNRKKRLKKNKAWGRRNKRKLADYRKTYYQKNREKKQAREAVSYAIRNGKIVRPENCEKCNVSCIPHAHHWKGYEIENRLNVQWLCHKCHLTKYM